MNARNKYLIPAVLTLLMVVFHCGYSQGWNVELLSRIYLPDYALGVAVQGGYACVATYFYGLVIIDVHDPSNPFVAGASGTPGVAYDVAISGSYAYLADGDGGLCIYDISHPNNPTQIGYCYGLYSQSVTVSGNFAYVADDWAGLRIINVSNPSNPVLVGGYNTPGEAFGVAVSGNYAYVADYGQGMWVLDISDPANPVEVGHYAEPFGGNAFSVTIGGSYAFLSDLIPGVRIIDISNPSNPVEIAYYDNYGNASHVALAGIHAYVAFGTAGLTVLNVLDPSNPIERGFYNTPDNSYSVAVSESGRYAYVPDVSSFMIFDCSAAFSGAAIEVSCLSLDFDSVEVGHQGSLPLTIYGTGGLPVILHDIYSVGSGFNTNWMPEDSIIGTCDSLEITVTFNPDSAVEYQGIVFIENNVREIVVALHGIGTPPNAIDPNPLTDIPKSFALYAPYPNPFNLGTMLSFALPRNCPISLIIYDVNGRKVETVANGNYPAGMNRIGFDASELSSGVYFARLTSGGFSQTQKMVVLK